MYNLKTVCCSLPAKIQPAITSFSANEFRWQPALSDNPENNTIIHSQ